jgi:hypothetical protein
MKSIGKILRSQREKKKLVLDEVYKNVKIHPRYIKALENDDYSVFEGKVHAKGFLKIYADYLGLDLSELLALWRREYEAGFESSKEEKFYQIKPLEPSKFAVTPGVVVTILVTLLVVAFFGYLLHQYRSYTGNPLLEIYHPENNLMTDSDILDVTGRSELDSEVFINNQKVVLGPNGGFAVSIKLKEGINTLSIISINKLNKKTEEIRTVIYRPQRAPIIESDELEEPEESTESAEESLEEGSEEEADNQDVDEIEGAGSST